MDIQCPANNNIGSYISFLLGASIIASIHRSTTSEIGVHMKKFLAILFALMLTGSFTLLTYRAGSAALREAQVRTEPVVLFVLSGGTSATCTSWTDACELQAAITASQEGDEIWVGAGTYKPTSGADRAVSFVLKDGVAIYGGFSGAETLREQRNWTTNPTILSGEIGDPNQTNDNSYHVVTTIGVPATTILDGFTIRDGGCRIQTHEVEGFSIKQAAWLFSGI